MSENKFTSGKWSLDSGNFTIRTDEKEICVIDLWATHFKMTEDERCANAQLIADAPEMFEICDAISSYMESSFFNVETVREDMKFLLNGFKKISEKLKVPKSEKEIKIAGLIEKLMRENAEGKSK